MAILARDRRHDADGQVAGLEHRALLDVNLAVAEQTASTPPVLSDAVGVAPKCAHRLAHRDPTGVDAVEVAEIESSRDSPAAEVGGTEPQPFLIGESEHLDCKGQPLAGVIKTLESRDRHHHAQRSVVFARIANTVQVRAEQKGAASGVRTLVTAAQVACVVAPHGHPGLAHPLGYALLRTSHRLRCKWSRDGTGILGA